MQEGWEVDQDCQPENGSVRFVRREPTPRVEQVSASLQATQMLLLLAIPRVARPSLVQQLVDVATELAEGRGPANLHFKRVLREARRMRDMQRIVDTFEELSRPALD